MKKYFSPVCFLVISILFSGCARIYLKKGNKEFTHMSYVKAIRFYNNSLHKKESLEARTNLAHSYRLTNDMIHAEAEYQKVIAEKGSEPICLFYYARVLMELGKYNEAELNFKKYLETNPEDVVARMLLASCRSVTTFKRDTTLFTLSKVELDKVASVFGCISYKEGMVCTAEKEVGLTGKKNPWTGKSYLDLYYTQQDTSGKWISPQVLKGNINGLYHEGPATFNKEENVVYFTRSNYFRGSVYKSSKGINNLKIFRAELIGGKWKNLEEMPFCSDEFSTGHPALSPDGVTLYFVSDRPGGYGGTDLYLSFYDGGKWSPPMNLGPSINTPGNEMFPYAAEDGSFYFSSDAHNNMGGLDVFVSSYSGKKWLQPENLNYPLNSSRDDFGFMMKNDSVGFVSSTRSDTDQVYRFTKHEPKFTVAGIVRDKKTGGPLASATVTLVGKKMTSLTTDAGGHYFFDLQPRGQYHIFTSYPGYFSQSEKVVTKGVKYSTDFKVDFEMTQIIIEKPIVLENIYYDLDKWEIRADAEKELDKLVKILNDNPNIHVELGSHTDSRAGDQYNLVLSDRRAMAVVNYLASKGIRSDRLTWKGYGETRLVNQCVNNAPCTEDEHQPNRRTEFKVTKILPPLK